MKMSARSLTRFVLGTVAGIGAVALLLPQPGWAQTTSDVNSSQNITSLEGNDPFSGESNDPFSGTNDGNSFGMFDLIHRAQQGNIRGQDEFSAEQNESLDAASARFRAEQIRKIQQQQQAAPANPVNMPQVAN